VNLGHVGFLAEADPESLDEAVNAVIQGDYRVEERMTVEACVVANGGPVRSTWALNEAVVEKTNRERILDVVLEVDGRPVTGFGCDGMMCSTPTGSTAYAFSAGGPVVWPEVEALLLVPLTAHALFARPLVIAPSSQVAVEVDARGYPAVLVCDGRRTVPVPPGARVELARGELPVRLVRLRDQPFADRLVRKFNLPVRGWRGAASPPHPS
jgi:NAD+ kinase